MVKGRPRIVAIIQARIGSTRLPGKVLKELAGQPMLWHVVNRARQAKTPSETIVATTTQPEDDAVVQLCERQGWTYFRGSADDVLDRYYRAALVFKAELIVRINADCPLIDPHIIDYVIKAHLSSGADYTFCGVIGGFPLGLDTEVFNFKTLERTYREAKQDYEREHVTPYIYEHPGIFKINSVKATGKLKRPDLRLTVDTKEDFELIEAIYQRLYRNGKIFYIEDVIELLDEHPELTAINAGIRQKKLGE